VGADPAASIALPIGVASRLVPTANDLFIAAHARALRLTLVTNNIAEFERVRDLKLENWTLPARRSR